MLLSFGKVSIEVCFIAKPPKGKTEVLYSTDCFVSYLFIYLLFVVEHKKRYLKKRKKIKKDVKKYAYEELEMNRSRVTSRSSLSGSLLLRSLDMT